MARRRKQFQNRPLPISEPLYSLRTVTYVVGGFLFFIGTLVFLSSSDKSSSLSLNETLSSSVINKRLFTNVNDIPEDLLSSFDAILVLGGGVPDDIDHPPIYVQRRADDAAAVVRRHEKIVLQQQQQNKNRKQRESSSNKSSTSPTLPILCLSAGTAHLPQLLSSDGLPIWESTSCAAYLSQNYNLDKTVYVETTSYDTIGNAFYTRTTHTDINGWRKLLIVTNEFHMERTQAIFDWIFLQCDPITITTTTTTTGTGTTSNPYSLSYLSSPNVGLSQEAVQARKEREGQSTNTVRQHLSTKYTSLAQVYTFMTQEHALYTASKLIERGRGGGDPKASWMVRQSYGAAK